MSGEWGTPPTTHDLGQPRRVWRRTRPVAGGLALAGALLVAFAVYTWVIAGAAQGVAVDLELNRNYPVREYVDLLRTLDRIGQRAVCLPLLAVVVAVVAWRHRAARPILVAVVAVLAVNLLVLVLKIWLGRGAPVDRAPEFFIGGQMYPSGHASNIVSVYGMCVYLISQYATVARRTRQLMWAFVALLGIVMTLTSVLLHWHWFSDLVGGFLVGGAVLVATVTIDKAVPFRSRRLVVVPATSPGDAAPVPQARRPAVSPDTLVQAEPVAAEEPTESQAEPSPP